MKELHLSDYVNEDFRSRILPEPTASDFAWAQANPGKWKYFTDPRADKSALRKQNVLGGRLADGNGGFAETWVNPEFIPVPQSVDVELTNEFELVLWRAMWGFNNVAWLIEAFSRGEFIVVLSPDDPQGRHGWPFRPYGSMRKLNIYTSPIRLPKDVNPWLRQVVSGRELLEQVCPQESVWLSFNPGPERRPGDDLLQPTIPGAHLTGWWHEWSEADERARLATESDAT
ncbi:hypothetical protein [Nocardia sp. Marseille-Q1738]